MWEADKSCEAFQMSLHMLLDRPVCVFFTTSTLSVNNQPQSCHKLPKLPLVPSAGNYHSKCHLCQGQGFKLLGKQGKLFRTTRTSPSSSCLTSPRVLHSTHFGCVDQDAMCTFVIVDRYFIYVKWLVRWPIYQKTWRQRVGNTATFNFRLMFFSILSE